MYRLVFGYVAAALIRHTYYFAWLMAESACILIGFGYNGKNKDGSIRWYVIYMSVSHIHYQKNKKFFNNI